MRAWTVALMLLISVSASAADVQKPIRIEVAPSILADLTRERVTVRLHHAEDDAEYEGVSLTSVLARAGAPFGDKLRGKAVARYIVVTAADDYRATFALAEIDPAFDDKVILLADRKNGSPLPKEEGPFRLIVPRKNARHAGCDRCARSRFASLDSPFTLLVRSSYHHTVGFFHSLLLSRVKPENELEEKLLSFLKGKTELDSFLNALLESKVFLLVKGNGEEIIAGAGFVPLVIGGAGGQPALAVFTSPERSTPLQKGLPEFRSSLLIEFPAVLSVAPPGLGLAINPGTMFSTEATHEGLDDLRGMAAARFNDGQGADA